MRIGRTQAGKTWHGMANDTDALCGAVIRFVSKEWQGDLGDKVQCQRCLKRMGFALKPDALKAAKAYAKDRGYRVQVKALRMQERRFAYAVRQFRTTGRCSISGYTWAWNTTVSVETEPGYEHIAALALCHEMGHAEAFQTGGLGISRRSDSAQARLMVELDAWERGLRIAGELGLAVGAEEAEFALACIGSYMNGRCSIPPGGTTIYDYLWELAQSGA